MSRTSLDYKKDDLFWVWFAYAAYSWASSAALSNNTECKLEN